MNSSVIRLAVLVCGPLLLGSGFFLGGYRDRSDMCVECNFDVDYCVCIPARVSKYR
jgi:hypothetical protein